MQSLPIIQLVLSIIVIVTILLQRSDRGLDGAFGGSDSGNGIQYKRRGAELFLFRASIVSALALVISIVAGMM